MRVLVVGYGSIGSRHCEVLSSLGHEVEVLTSKDLKEFKSYKSFDEIPLSEFDYFVIATPTNKHFENLEFLNKNVKNKIIFCEKPLFESKKASLKLENSVFVGYVLRYHPCFLKVKELIESGELGKIITINHTEGVGIDRDTHSYVRGIMNREKENNPMLLAKCCHDIDFLIWIAGVKCRRLSSFGSLLWFKESNAPEGSALRCIDCKVEEQCPYSAVDLYWRRREWISNFDIPKGQTLDDVLQKELKEGRYGRCVYHSDNDVVDNQVLTMQMEDGMLITLCMDVFTQRDYRTTDVKLTEGEIICDEKKVYVTRFRGHRQQVYDFSDTVNQLYHAGADLKIVEDFVLAVRGEIDSLPTMIDGSLESHLICFEAENSRLSGKTIHLLP